MLGCWTIKYQGVDFLLEFPVPMQWQLSSHSTYCKLFELLGGCAAGRGGANAVNCKGTPSPPRIGTEAEVTGFSTPGILCSGAGSAGCRMQEGPMQVAKVFVHKNTVSTITYTRSQP